MNTHNDTPPININGYQTDSSSSSDVSTNTSIAIANLKDKPTLTNSKSNNNNNNSNNNNNNNSNNTRYGQRRKKLYRKTRAAKLARAAAIENDLVQTLYGRLNLGSSYVSSASTSRYYRRRQRSQRYRQHQGGTQKRTDLESCFSQLSLGPPQSPSRDTVVTTASNSTSVEGDIVNNCDGYGTDTESDGSS